MDDLRKTAPKIILFSFVLFYLVLGIFIAKDFGVSMDDQVETEKSALALDIYLANLDEDPYSAFESFTNTNDKFYGTASTMLIRFVEKYFFPNQNHSTMIVAHYGYFVFFQVGVVTIFYLAKHFVDDWTSLVVVLLFGTQPIFFGHAFINSKDIPLLAVFLATVVLGFGLIDRWDKNAHESDLDIRPRAELKRMKVWFISILLVLFLILWSGPWVAGFARYLVEYSYNSKDISWLGKIFALLTTSGSLKGYQGLIHIKVLGIYRWLGLFSLIMLWGLFYWAGKNQLFGYYINLSMLVASAVWGFAISTRVLSIAAGGIVGIYCLIKIGKKAVFPLIVYTLTASLFSVLTWPFLWVYGIPGLIDSLVAFSDYSWKGLILFEGIAYRPHEVPVRYVPQMMALQLTEPLIIFALVGFILSLYLIYRYKANRAKIILLYAWLGLPIIYLLIANPTVYNNFRQFMFITPPLFILAGLVLQQVFSRVKISVLKTVISVLIIVPGIFSIVRLHPLQYIYYNSFTGGVEGAQNEYPLDYWNTSFVIAMKYLNDNAPEGSKILVWKDDDRGRIYAEKYFTFAAHTVVSEEEYSSFDYAIMVTGHYDDIEQLNGIPVVFTVQIDGINLLSVLKITNSPGN